MNSPVSVRLNEPDREILERAASQKGEGLSTYVRSLAEAEAERLRRAEIRAQGDAVVSYLRANPEAAAELDALGTPLSEE